jgi:hypothetical protein
MGRRMSRNRRGVCDYLYFRPAGFSMKVHVLGRNRMLSRVVLAPAMMIHVWTQLIQRIPGFQTE